MNVNQLDTLLGDSSLYREYLEELNYYVGDLCFFDSVNDSKVIKRCIKDTTGPFDDTCWEDPKDVNGYVTFINDSIEIYTHKFTYNSSDYTNTDIMKFSVTFPKSGINSLLIKAFSVSTSALVSEILISLLNEEVKENTCIKKIGNTFLSFDKPVKNANSTISINIYYNITDELKFEVFIDDATITASNTNSYTINPDIGTKYGFKKAVNYRYTSSLCDASSLLSLKDWDNDQITEFSTPLVKMEKLYNVYNDFYNLNKTEIDTDINTTDVLLSSIEDKLSFISNYLASGLPIPGGDIDADKAKLINEAYDDPKKPKNKEIEEFRKLIADNIDSIPGTLSTSYEELDTIPVGSNNMALLTNSKNDLNFNLVKGYTDYNIYDMKLNENLLYILYGNSSNCFIDVLKSDKNVFDNLVGTYNLGIAGTKLLVIDSNIALVLNKDTKLLYAITIGLSENTFSIDSTYYGISDIDYTENYIVLLKDDTIISLKYDKKTFFDKKIYQKPDSMIGSFVANEINNNLYIYSLVNGKILIFDLDTNQLETLDSYKYLDFKISRYGTIYAIAEDLTYNPNSPSKFIIYDFSTFNFVEIASEYLSFDPSHIYVSNNGTNIMISGKYNSQIYQYNKHFNIIKKCLNPNINGGYLVSNGFVFIYNAFLYVYAYKNGVYFNYINNYIPSYGGLTNKNLIYSTSCGNRFAILSKDDETEYSVIIYEILQNKEIHIIRNYTFTSDREVKRIFLLKDIFIYYTIDTTREVSLYYIDISTNSDSLTFKKLNPTYEIGTHNIDYMQTLSTSLLYPILNVDHVEFVELEITSNPDDLNNPNISEGILCTTNYRYIDKILVKTCPGDKIFFISRSIMTMIDSTDITTGLYQYLKETKKIVKVSSSTPALDCDIIAADFNNAVSYVSSGKLKTVFNKYKDSSDPVYTTDSIWTYSYDSSKYNVVAACPIISTSDTSSNLYSAFIVIYSNGLIELHKHTYNISKNTITATIFSYNASKAVIPTNKSFVSSIRLNETTQFGVITIPTSPGIILTTAL